VVWCGVAWRGAARHHVEGHRTWLEAHGEDDQLEELDRFYRAKDWGAV
jgi:hypothetical protein